MFYTEEKANGIKIYKSSIFDDGNLTHAFTTRVGGNTPPPLATFSMGSAHNPELKPFVEENRRKICKTLGLNYKNLIIPDQKHTDNIKIVSSPQDDISECDGLITDNPGLVLMLLFADCVPVIIYSPDRHVVSIIHAGRKGTSKSIVKKAVNILEKDFNADIKKIKAAIGPAVGSCCYPVSPETANELKTTIETDYDNIFITNIKNTGSVFVDLKKLNARQLIESGVVHIDKSDNCTSCMNSVFYSHRAENGKTGRHASIASLSRR